MLSLRAKFALGNAFFSYVKTAFKEKWECDWQWCWLPEPRGTKPSTHIHIESFLIRDKSRSRCSVSLFQRPLFSMKISVRICRLERLDTASPCQVNTHRAVVVGGKSFQRSASQTNSYYCSLKQPPLETGVCGDCAKKQLTICCTSKGGAKKTSLK